jgi:hypothetical protein
MGYLMNAPTTVRLVDANTAMGLIETTIRQSRDEAWGGAFLSAVLYPLIAYSLLIHEETTLAWSWRIFFAGFFALICATFIRGAITNGRFILGLSKQGLIYKLKKSADQYVVCPWSSVDSIKHHYDGEQDFVVIELSSLSADAIHEPTNGHIDVQNNTAQLRMVSRSKGRALEIISMMKKYWGRHDEANRV